MLTSILALRVGLAGTFAGGGGGGARKGLKIYFDIVSMLEGSMVKLLLPEYIQRSSGECRN